MSDSNKPVDRKLAATMRPPTSTAYPQRSALSTFAKFPTRATAFPARPHSGSQRAIPPSIQHDKRNQQSSASAIASIPRNISMPPFKKHPWGIEIDGWTISSFSRPMAGSNELKEITDKIGLHNLPEMVFAKTYLRCKHANGLNLYFHPVEALKKCVGKPSDPVQAQYAMEWSKSAHSIPRTDVQRLDFNYDWTFTTDYIGSVMHCSSASYQPKIVKSETERLNIALLTREDPILFHSFDLLFEDELSDCGLSQLFVRCRVMPQCWLVLCRHWMRVDNVIVRVRDTRLYFEHGKNFVVRNTQFRQMKWDELRKANMSVECADYVDPNVFTNKLPLRSDENHLIYL